MDTDQTKIAVLGRGAWGSALAATLEGAGRPVLRWSRASVDAAVAECSLILCATPAQSTRRVLERLRPHLAPGCRLVMAAKGLEYGTLARQSQIAQEILPKSSVAVLSGPGFAEDLASGLPIAVTLASKDAEAEDLQKALFTRQLRPYLSADLVGVELGGALKNVIALASGVVVGAGLGESARAAIIARGFAEMQRIACGCGAQTDTLLGLAGLGDLTLTATSLKSRNYRCGLQLGEAGSVQKRASALGNGPVGDRQGAPHKEPRERYPEQGGETVEGVATAAAALQLATAHGIDVPLIQSVADLLAGHRSVPEITAELLARPLRRETTYTPSR